MSFQLNLDKEPVDHTHPVPPICVEPDCPVREVFAILRGRQRGSVLICRQGVLTGIFTERDALRLMADGADLDVPVAQVMVDKPVTVAATDSMGQAITKMSEGGYRHLPIVDETQRPVGMVKVSGILHYLVEHFPNVVYTLPPTPHHTTRQREGA